MEVLPWFLPAAAVFVTSTLLIFISSYLRSPKLNLPPGPKPWPIIGNLDLIGDLPYQSIHELSQKYGPIMQLRFGSISVVVGSSVDMARQFLKVQDQNFASRPKSTAGMHTTYDHRSMQWAPYGPYWRHARKIFYTELFNPKRLDSCEYIRIEELRGLVSDLYSSGGKPIVLIDYFCKLPLNYMTRLVLGKYLGETVKELKPMFDEFARLNGVLNIGDCIPWINFLDLQGYVKQMKALGKNMDQFLESEINEHIERTKYYNGTKVMLDTLLLLEDHPNPDLKLSREETKSLIWDLLAGVTDTTTPVEWTMAELLKHPDIFERATKELDEVIGRNRWVEEKDIPNLPYLKAIIYETMRMHPVSPMLVPHFNPKNCQMLGYDILEGTQILVNVWSIGRDPTLWEEPNEFRPERFMGRDIDIRGQHLELLPFGSGRRMCPGHSLGLKFIEVGLANLLHGFNWKLPDQMQPEDLNMDEVWGITVPKKVQLVAVAEPRLPLHVYSL